MGISSINMWCIGFATRVCGCTITPVFGTVSSTVLRSGVYSFLILGMLDPLIVALTGGGKF